MNDDTQKKYRPDPLLTVLPEEKQASQEDCCCGPPSKDLRDDEYHNVSEDTGVVSTPVGDVPRVATNLTWRDRIGSWKVRWGIGRMKYAIRPGLYAVGTPTSVSPVLVTANYKMSFDRLRSQLAGRDAWIMVLDTRAVNVWCAAGKGTFGTEEIINRLRQTRLHEIVSHRRLILPQLGAPGVQAHVVKKTGKFAVRFGPVRASDLPDYLDNDMKATAEMRRVRFSVGDRIVLAPVDVVSALKQVFPVLLVLFALSGVGPDLYAFDRMLSTGLITVAAIVGAVLAGGAITPILLPYLPGRSFAAKGAWAGTLLLISFALFRLQLPFTWLTIAGLASLVLAVSSFVGMNFTGASTYTSLSGVKKEMRVAVPLQITSGAVGLGLWVTGRFL